MILACEEMGGGGGSMAEGGVDADVRGVEVLEESENVGNQQARCL